jgi:hypothetical protein
MVSWPELVSTALRGREMKQMFIVGHGGPEKLQLRESADPSPAAGEIRIRVKASGINFADILARRACIRTRLRFPVSLATRSLAWWTPWVLVGTIPGSAATSSR